jgi:hypothetical protein
MAAFLCFELASALTSDEQPGGEAMYFYTDLAEENKEALPAHLPRTFQSHVDPF